MLLDPGLHPRTSSAPAPAAVSQEIPPTSAVQQRAIIREDELELTPPPLTQPRVPRHVDDDSGEEQECDENDEVPDLRVTRSTSQRGQKGKDIASSSKTWSPSTSMLGTGGKSAPKAGSSGSTTTASQRESSLQPHQSSSTSDRKKKMSNLRKNLV